MHQYLNAGNTPLYLAHSYVRLAFQLFFCQCGNKNTKPFLYRYLRFVNHIINLNLRWLYNADWICKPSWTNNLFYEYIIGLC
jgi:hypothetical protein